MNRIFIIDISDRDPEYLAGIYDPGGRLIAPVKGSVVPLGSLFPIVRDEREDNYDLLAAQRIIGLYNADTLAYPETFLSWDQGVGEFVPDFFCLVYMVKNISRVRLKN